MYLTIEEFKNMSMQDTDKSDEDVIKLINQAEKLLDIQTRFYYHVHNFDKDSNVRKLAVKNAIVAQVDFYIESGFSSVYGLNTDVTSVSMGRTSISKGRGGGGNKFTDLTGICVEFWHYLQGTGLLYRGVK